MKPTCVVGNITELPSSFLYLLEDNTIDILATDKSSIDFCYHMYFEKFDTGSFQRCIAIYGPSFSRHVHFDNEDSEVVTPNSKYAELFFLEDGNNISDFANECYTFRLFLNMYMICHAREIELCVIDGNDIVSADEFVKRKLDRFGDATYLCEGNGFKLCGYHNSHNEYLERIQGKDNLLIVIGDSWVVGDNRDTAEEWVPGQLANSFGNLVATHFDSDIVVCGSPGNSNRGAVLNFCMWYLLHPDFTNEYKDVTIIFSNTAESRDCIASGNVGSWDSNELRAGYIALQRKDKMLRDSEIAISTFSAFVDRLPVNCYYMINHSASVMTSALSTLDKAMIIRPVGNKLIHDYNHYFKFDLHPTGARVGYFSSCRHPNDRGNKYLAQEVIKHIKGF